MLVNIRNIWVLKDFIIVDMTKIDDAQIILGRPLLATAGCHIEARKGRITFELQGCDVVFYHMEEKAVSPNSSLLDELPLPLRYPPC